MNAQSIRFGLCNDAVNEANKIKLHALPVSRMAAIAFQLLK